MSGERSSFYWPMRLLPRPQREALLALYGFCQAVDTAADAPNAPAEALVLWKEECASLAQGKAHTREGIRLLPHMATYRLDAGLLSALVEGCAQDLAGMMVAPSRAALEAYCAQVAVAPGLLVLSILKRRGTQEDLFAYALGQALQRTNILRDILEDAARGRLYYPREMLEEAGLQGLTPAALLADPSLAPRLRRTFADETRIWYARAEEAATPCGPHRLTTALLMRDVYWQQFRTMEARNWKFYGKKDVATCLWTLLPRLFLSTIRHRFWNAFN